MKDADCAVIVYDITNRKSFQNIVFWNNLFEEHKQDGAIKFLIGNKADLSEDRQITKSEAEKEMESIKAVRWMELSAKTGKKLD